MKKSCAGSVSTALDEVSFISAELRDRLWAILGDRRAAWIASSDFLSGCSSNDGRPHRQVGPPSGPKTLCCGPRSWARSRSWAIGLIIPGLLRIPPSLTRRHNGGILFGGCVDLEAGRSTILRDHPRARGEPPRLADLIVGREVGCLEDRGEVQEGW